MSGRSRKRQKKSEVRDAVSSNLPACLPACVCVLSYPHIMWDVKSRRTYRGGAQCTQYFILFTTSVYILVHMCTLAWVHVISYCSALPGTANHWLYVYITCKAARSLCVYHHFALWILYLTCCYEKNLHLIHPFFLLQQHCKPLTTTP